MKTACVLPFRIGDAVAAALPVAALEVYLWTAGVILSDECEVDSHAPRVSIPIANSDVVDRPYVIHGHLFDRVSRAQSDVDLFILDLNNPHGEIVRAQLLWHLAHAILELAEQRPKVRFLILLTELPAEGDEFLSGMQPLIAGQRAWILADQAKAIPSTIETTLDLADYASRMVEARGKPLDLARKKLVRRLGHFRRETISGAKRCVRYFYDGSLCEDEIGDLIQEFVIGKFPDPSDLLLLHHGVSSEWLDRAVLRVATDLQLPPIKLPVDVSEMDLADGRQTKSLLVVDMVDTGRILMRILDELRGRGVEPTVLSILTTSTTNKTEHRRRLSHHGTTVDIHYLFQVDQRPFPDACPMCELEIPPSSIVREEFLMLRTMDMWEMAFAAKTKPEDNVPTYRKQLPAVVRYPELVENNGAWLASKIRQRLAARPIGYPADAIVVCPDEPGSRAFSAYLRLVLHFSIVKIPRPVIDRCGNAQSAIAAKQSSESELWHAQLATVTSAEIIVMDEFDVSRSTLRRLSFLLAAFGKEPSCYFPLNDLNPSHRLEGNVPTYALYEWHTHFEMFPTPAA